MRPPGSPPRWRCLIPGCPLGRRWQRVTTWGEYDPLDVALEEFERHYAKHHGQNETETQPETEEKAA